MNVTTKHYCHQCSRHQTDELETIRSKFASIPARISTHAHVTGKTFKAHPIEIAIWGTVLVAALVAGSALLGMGVILPGVIVLALSLDVLILGIPIFAKARSTVSAQAYKKAHSIQKMKNWLQPDQKVCLVIEATYDHNDAFCNKGPKKWEKDYPIIHVQASNIGEVDAIIKQIAAIAKIQVLWIAAHGCPNLMQLSENDFIHMNNVAQLKDSLRMLEKDAAVVLQSCETGQEIAGELSRIAIGRHVVAPTISIDYREIHLKSGKISIEATKLGINERESFGDLFQVNIGNFIDLILPNFIGKHLRENVMNVFQDGQLVDHLGKFKLPT